MTTATARTVVAGLRSLRTSTPPGFKDAVLEALAQEALEEVSTDTDSYAQMSTSLWPLLVAWGDEGISAVERADANGSDAGSFEADYRARTGRPVRRTREVPVRIRGQVLRRIRGEAGPGAAVDLAGLNPFARLVLAKTMEIPYGEVRPYAWVAAEIGHPRAQRAVGTALAHNPVPFVIPCHRVVRSDGHIGRYGAGGPEAKRAVLRSEGVDPDELERLANAGIRYIGSDTGHVACFPTCRHARRIKPGHRVAFRTSVAAVADGYRACRSCRPFTALPAGVSTSSDPLAYQSARS